MAISDLGITSADFEDQAFSDLSQSVTRTPRTKTISNYTGSPTYTEETSETISAIFRQRGQTFDWAKEGLFEDGDAFMQVKSDQNLDKEDYIIVDSIKYRVDNVIIRQIGGTTMFKACNLFKVE